MIDRADAYPWDPIACGYRLRVLENGHVVWLVSKLFTWALVVGPDGDLEFDKHWCYETREEAVRSALDWDGDYPETEPTGWIRDPYTGRRHHGLASDAQHDRLAHRPYDGRMQHNHTEDTAGPDESETPALLTPTLGDAEIAHRFGFHKATIEGENATLPRHRYTRLAFREFASQLDAILPDGRAKSVAFTELENASMWAHKSIAEQAPVVQE